MVIVRLRGGLGNQLFQYAAAQSLAWQNGVPVKLDLYTYTRSKARKFGLDRFSIDAVEATREEVHAFTGSNPVIRYLNKRENYLRCLRVLSQPHYHYFEDFFSVQVPVYLSGYWQSEKYFSQHREKLTHLFTLKNPLSASSARWQSQITATESVAIHVRRGDYIANATYGSFFGTLPIAYYEQAVREVRKRIADPSFFVFSDDIDWCRENFSFLREAKFVTHEHAIDPGEDLFLIQCCRHQVIANSTFSWWGAWLNANPEKTVIAPEKWFATNFTNSIHPPYASRYYNTKDLLPETWIRL